jgi:outer membrane receptor protein involved in Fe transport
LATASGVRYRLRVAPWLASAACLLLAGGAGAATGAIEEVVVSAEASLATRLGNLGSVSALSADEIEAIGATHVNEALGRIAGVWVARGSGQEHLTAIRSPVYAGLGACGEFLYLEDGIPIRPAGFCNINNLFEVNSEQAGAIEVWRGPASALLGGNALRGAVNFLSPVPARNQVSVEAGPYDFYRVALQARGAAGGHEFGASANGMQTNGWRDHTDYDQQKASFFHGARIGVWEVRNTLNLSLLNQETGAFVPGYKAYEQNPLRRSNPSPNSYRDAWSMRAASHWSAAGWTITPYLRRSAMEFLQHFIPGEPWEDNSQTSGGVMLNHAWATDALDFELGGHAELMTGHLKEFQEEPLTTSTPFNNAVRPQGTHYDFDVDSELLAAYYDLAWAFGDALRLIHSLRFEWLRYDYDNRSLDGNTRDDGTPCGFGGCLYNRPADRDDTFGNVAGRLGVERSFDDGATVYGVVATGFRPPQVNELYRLQRGQDVADLDSERIVSVEVGYKRDGWAVAAFADRADNFIFRDSAGLNVSDGETESHGVELTVLQTWGRHTVELATTYAEHRYAFTGGATGGEFIEDGNMMDTAPRWLTNAAWRFAPTPRIESELELVVQGEHYINADNTAEYGGHEVLNWRGRYTLNDRATLFARVSNLLDEEYADRADYTVFDPQRYRYFPAMPRQLYVGVTLAL